MAALDWMGLSDRRRRPRRVAVAATAAAAAAAVATVIVVEATLGAASVSGAPTGHALSAHVRPLPGVTRAEAAGRSPNSSADPRTVAWVESLRAAAAAELPPLPSPDLFRRHDGLYTLHAGIGLAAGQVLLEVPKDQLEQPFRLFREFTAVDAAATEVLRRVDDTSVELTDRLLAFRLAPNTAPLTLELYRPPLRKRSVDPASMPGRQAVAGISSTTLQSFPARSLDGGRLLIDVSPLVASTFHLSEYAGWSSRFVAGTAHLRQVSFSIDTANAGGVGGFLTVTAVGLPRQRMVPRTLDDRIGCFASTYQWIDDYAGDKPAASGANIVKWDLAKNPVVHFYVDPSVPRALWPAVVEGVTRWNPAFEAAGHARPVLRAVIPTDSDWPSDYAVDDARFNTVSFAPGAMAGAVAGVKSDPRTGEIFNVDVVFYAPMLRSFTTLYRVWYRGDEPDGEESRARVAGRNASSIHTRIAESPPDERVPGSEEDYVYQNVADTTMHEVGHGLGLRHNFRGSAGIPWSQLTNTTFVETHGLSNSVMDYLPAEPLPRAKDDHERRYFTTPVIGAYDFAAIRYGYTAWKSDAEAHAYAASVAASGLAFATDEDQSADALTARFDLSSTPLEWHRHIVRTARARLARLARLARTVGTRPSTSATDFGADVKMLTGNGAGSILAAAKLVGGTVLNRRRTGGVPAAEPVDAATEAAAMAWVLEKIHPATGLLSPATVAAVAPYALAKPAAECGDDAACLGREPAGIVASLASARETILTSLVAASRLAQLDEHAAAAAAAAADGNGGRRRILAPDLLAALTKTFFGDRCAELPPATAAAAAAAPFRADAQVGWVAKLKALSEDANHGAVAAAAAGELSRIAAAVAAAVAATPDSVHLRGLRLSTAAFVV